MCSTRARDQINDFCITRISSESSTHLAQSRARTSRATPLLTKRGILLALLAPARRRERETISPRRAAHDPQLRPPEEGPEPPQRPAAPPTRGTLRRAGPRAAAGEPLQDGPGGRAPLRVEGRASRRGGLAWVRLEGAHDGGWFSVGEWCLDG